MLSLDHDRVTPDLSGNGYTGCLQLPGDDFFVVNYIFDAPQCPDPQLPLQLVRVLSGESFNRDGANQKEIDLWVLKTTQS
jgi:hypothetical protein